MKEIALDLKINHRADQAHRQNMMIKIDAGYMTMLRRFAVTHKLVQIEKILSSK
jgi:FixJ family two-component response regulator